VNELRGVVLIALLVVTAILAGPTGTRAIETAAMERLPYAMGEWNGADDDSLDETTAAELGADAYLTRTYSAAGGPPLGLYVAYYGSQRPGVSIHSPLHCLPGTGWEALAVATAAIPGSGAAAGGSARVVTMRKNFDRAVVIYWYQIHGRTVANEITSKLYLLSDSVRRAGSDAALVRIVVPVVTEPEAATAQGLSFARHLLPQLAPLL
jgi:EpsI family protein